MNKKKVGTLFGRPIVTGEIGSLKKNELFCNISDDKLYSLTQFNEKGELVSSGGGGNGNLLDIYKVYKYTPEFKEILAVCNETPGLVEDKVKELFGNDSIWAKPGMPLLQNKNAVCDVYMLIQMYVLEAKKYSNIFLSALNDRSDAQLPYQDCLYTGCNGFAFSSLDFFVYLLNSNDGQSIPMFLPILEKISINDNIFKIIYNVFTLAGPVCSDDDIQTLELEISKLNELVTVIPLSEYLKSLI